MGGISGCASLDPGHEGTARISLLREADGSCDHAKKVYWTKIGVVETTICQGEIKNHSEA